MTHGLTSIKHQISIALAIVGFLVGLLAAWYWYRSTLVQPQLGESEPFNPHAIEPVDPELKSLTWHVQQTDASQAIWDAQVLASREVGRLNAKAAVWTAVALVLSTAASVLGATQ